MKAVAVCALLLAAGCRGSTAPSADGSPTPTPPPASSASPTPSRSAPPGLRGEALESWRRWQEHRPSAYRFTLTRTCYCPGNEPVTMTVRGDEASSAKPAVLQATSVDDLFGTIATAQSGSRGHERAGSVELRFDAELGYPVNVSIDWITNAIDDEVAYSVQGLRAL